MAGGDFAAALASGHPVIAKSHPLHPGTTRRLAELAIVELDGHGLPKATVQLLHDVDPADGLRLVADPRVAATAFTGSRQVGLSLKAAADAAGKPIYLEMSSPNPVVVLPEAAPTNGFRIGRELASSVLNGMGQFCTCPGLVFVTEAGEEHLRRGLDDGMSSAVLHPMLASSVAERFLGDIETLIEGGARRLFVGPRPPGIGCEPLLLQVDGGTFASRSELFQREAFGPSTLMVTCRGMAELVACLERLEGCLAGSIYSDAGGADDAEYALVEPLLRTKVGDGQQDIVPL